MGEPQTFPTDWQQPASCPRRYGDAPHRHPRIANLNLHHPPEQPWKVGCHWSSKRRGHRAPNYSACLNHGYHKSIRCGNAPKRSSFAQIACRNVVEDPLIASNRAGTRCAHGQASCDLNLMQYSPHNGWRPRALPYRCRGMTINSPVLNACVGRTNRAS